MDRGFACLDEPGGIADLAVAELLAAASEVLSRCAAFGDGVIDAFAFDFQCHLGQGSHDGEDHGAHRCASVNIPAAQVQDPQMHASGTQVLGKSKHVHRGPAEPVLGGDHQSVALMQRVQRPGKSPTGCPGTADSVVNIQVIMADARNQQVPNLPVGILRLSGNSGVPDQFCHGRPESVLQPVSMSLDLPKSCDT